MPKLGKHIFKEVQIVLHQMQCSETHFFVVYFSVTGEPKVHLIQRIKRCSSIQYRSRRPISDVIWGRFLKWHVRLITLTPGDNMSPLIFIELYIYWCVHGVPRNNNIYEKQVSLWVPSLTCHIRIQLDLPQRLEY